jgi:RNA polymerase sigma-70 factor (ECF subfamily)
MVQDVHLAEDIFQSVSLLAVQKRGELRDERALPTWLRSAARLQSLAALRQKARAPQMLSDAVLDQVDARFAQLDRTPADELMAALRDCVQELTPNNQQLLTLRYGQGLPGHRVAVQLNRTPHAIYTALSRIHNRLRDCVRRRLALENVDHA